MESMAPDLLIRGIALSLLAAVLLFLFRRRASAYRHLICVLALAALMVLPAARNLMPALPLLTPRIAIDRTPIASSRPTIDGSRSKETAHVGVSRETDALTSGEGTIGAAGIVGANASASGHPKFRSAEYLLAIWVFGSAIFLIRLVVALVRLNSLRVNARAADIEGVSVLVTERARSPLTWGVYRPVILMPYAVFVADPAVRNSALRHELAHIARRDWATNLLAEVACALFWFQPGAWWLRERMRMESELACDDQVILSGVSAADYAEHLLGILKSARNAEIAPAMANHGLLTDRIGHILDGGASRETNRVYAVTVAVGGLLLFSFSALRVSARESLRLATAGTISAGVLAEPSNALMGADSQGSEVQGYALTHTLSTGNPAPLRSATPTELPVGPEPYGGRVLWGEAVNGLQPGLLPAMPGYSANRTYPFNTNFEYRVLVRNTSSTDKIAAMQLINTDGFEIPYLVPEAYHAGMKRGDSVPARYRAAWNSSPFLGEFPAYAIRLSAGESVVLPGGMSLYVGNKDKSKYPRIENVEQGWNWILQPVTVQLMSPQDLKNSGNILTKVIFIDANGKTRERGVPTIPASTMLTPIYAPMRVDIGGAQGITSANRPPAGWADAIWWGDIRNGMRLGLRLPKGVVNFPALSEARFDVLLRNNGDKPVTAAYLGYPTINQYSPEIFTGEGKRIPYIKTIAGPYLNDSTKLEPGETIVIGTIALPHGESTELDTVAANATAGADRKAAGMFLAEFNLDIAVPAGHARLTTGRIQFFVTGARPTK